MGEYYWLLGLFFGLLAAVSTYCAILLFPKKGWWVLLFLPPLMVILVTILFEGRLSIYISGHIIGGFGVGWSLAQFRRIKEN